MDNTEKSWAKRSFGPDYECQFLWPKSCFVQCGGSEKYSDGCFFEAFPKNPNTYIRCKGDTIEVAEKKCWEYLQKYNSCELDHTNSDNFDKRDYKNGCGFCKKCGFFASEIFPPSEICVCCKSNTYFTYDVLGNWYCENCVHKMPEEHKADWQKETQSSLGELSQQEFEQGLKEVLIHLSETCKEI